MIFTIVIGIITCLAIILVSIIHPSVKIKGYKLNLYWIIALVGALLILCTNTVSWSEFFKGLTSEQGINPIQILLLFISMSIISIFLDEVGFFAYLANWVLSRCKKSQYVLFTCSFFLVSSLTMFTSNDIVILTLTPFIIFFCKNGKVNPIPYIVSEFLAANTWSMIFIIGNPTNIYLSQNASISFVDYFKVMWLPTLGAGIIEFILLFLIFRKQLKKPIEPNIDKDISCNKVYTIIGLSILIICTIFLIVSSYINIKMYLIAVIALGVLIVSILLAALISKNKPKELGKTLLRTPYEIIPFLLSMFAIVLAFEKYEITKELSSFLGQNNVIYTYGYSSLLMANLVNNIPMSVLFNSIINVNYSLEATYATIVSSNIGAFITPIGALAGIMWLGIVKEHDIKFSFLDFIKYGLPIGLAVVTVSLSLLFVTL